MPSPIPFHQFKRYFTRYGVKFINPRGGGSHHGMRRIVDGGLLLHRIPVHKNEVKYVYLKQARRAMNLTPEHGVTDEEFYDV